MSASARWRSAPPTLGAIRGVVPAVESAQVSDGLSWQAEEYERVAAQFHHAEHRAQSVSEGTCARLCTCMLHRRSWRPTAQRAK